MYLPISLAGGTYKNKDLELSAQRTVNFWPRRQQRGNEKSPYTLESFPGYKSFYNGSGSDRGMFFHGGVLYKLNNTVLSSISSTGVATTLGTIPGTGRAVFGGLGSTIIIVADGVAYTWDGSTLTTGNDVDFETPNTVAVINNQAIYDGDDNRFGVSDVGSPLSINALNYGSAEFKGDDLLRPYSFGTLVYMFGTETVEQWWNDTSVTAPPFSPIQNGAIEVGLGATYSVANTDSRIYFFADNNQVYTIENGVASPILPDPIVREIAAFDVKSDAIGWTMQYEGQWFYTVTFPAGKRTFIYPEGGEWFELSSGTDGEDFDGTGYVFAFGKHLISNKTGDILEIDGDTYTENGNTIRRERVLSPIHSGLFGRNGLPLEISYFRLIGKTGTGNANIENPEVILQYSDDGENWSTEQRANAGKLGKSSELIFEIGDTLENWIFRIISTDPAYSSWHSAAIEAEIGIE